MLNIQICVQAPDQRHILFNGLDDVSGSISCIAEYEKLLYNGNGNYQQTEEVRISMKTACCVTLRSLIRAMYQSGLSEGPDTLIKRLNFNIIYNFLIKNKGRVLIKEKRLILIRNLNKSFLY
jgi:hypothetical protein